MFLQVNSKNSIHKRPKLTELWHFICDQFTASSSTKNAFFQKMPKINKIQTVTTPVKFCRLIMELLLL